MRLTAVDLDRADGRLTLFIPASWLCGERVTLDDGEGTSCEAVVGYLTQGPNGSHGYMMTLDLDTFKVD